MARPTDYDPAFCERVIELGETGASIAEMAHEIGVHRNTLTNWASAHPEFLEAFAHATQASQVWWERAGRNNLLTSAFQGSVWSRSMAARFPDDWREVKGTELTGKGGGPIRHTTKAEDLADDDLATIAAGKP